MRNAEVLPLFARLSQAEQDRIFDGHTGRRIVLATNVAETSLTVPGIRYVIDAGTARVKRYSFRSKVEQLLVEPISQAAANQRAGPLRARGQRHLHPAVRRDRLRRPPALHRPGNPAQLAGRRDPAHEVAAPRAMVEDFPFIEAPSQPRDRRWLPAAQRTRRGRRQRTNSRRWARELAKLPLDPRVGRMILEARARGALNEVLVIASALSVQDVRDRPMDAQQQADQAHAKFDDEKSEFSGYLTLWKWLQEARGGTVPTLASARVQQQQAQARRKGSASQAFLPVSQRLVAPAPMPAPAPALAAGGAAPTHKLSNRQYEQLLRQNFINVRRVREWRDIHSPAAHGGDRAQVADQRPARQLRAAAPVDAGRPARQHRLQARGRGRATWARAASSSTATRARTCARSRAAGSSAPSWSRPRACSAAASPTSSRSGSKRWAAHLLKKQLLDPHWEKKAAEVVALERATLYGLVVYSGRRVDFDKVDPQAAREIFIREALVAGAAGSTQACRSSPPTAS